MKQRIPSQMTPSAASVMGCFSQCAHIGGCLEAVDDNGRGEKNQCGT